MACDDVDGDSASTADSCEAGGDAARSKAGDAARSKAGEHSSGEHTGGMCASRRSSTVGSTLVDPLPVQHRPTPSPWVEYMDMTTGRPYWHNRLSNESVWRRPEMCSWEEYVDPASGRAYWHDSLSGTTTWSRPSSEQDPPRGSADEVHGAAWRSAPFKCAEPEVARSAAVRTSLQGRAALAPGTSTGAAYSRCGRGNGLQSMGGAHSHRIPEPARGRWMTPVDEPREYPEEIPPARVSVPLSKRQASTIFI